MTKNKLKLLSALMLSVSITSSAQTLNQYRYQDAYQLWHNTDNIAGFTIDSMKDRGLTYVEVSHHEGEYHRIQDGGQRNDLHFHTERYQKIGKYLYGYGSFDFNKNRTKDRLYADEIRPYNSNPFISGSSIPGRYDLQSFDMTAAVATIAYKGWRTGIRLNYRLADLSRLKDPRSRAQLLDYQLTPALTYTLGVHTIGISGHYQRRKENVPNVNTVQNDPNIIYYTMSGMEAVQGTIGGYSSFSREWVNHVLGTELAYGYKSRQYSSVSTIGIERGSEGVYGTYKYQPGHYYTYLYKANTQHRITVGNILHTIDIHMQYTDAFADEYKQQLQATNDAATGFTSYHYNTQIKFKKRYQLQDFGAQLHYQAARIHNNQLTNYAGLIGKYTDTRVKHLLPTSSLRYKSSDINIEGGFSMPRQRLQIDANTGYHFAFGNKLHLADHTTLIAREVLLPDMTYLNANHWNATLSVTYQQPISIKNTDTHWFIKVYSQYLHTNKATDASTVGLTIGLLN